MKTTLILAALFAFAAPLAFAEEDSVIAEAMKFAHKAPKGEKKLNEKIADGTASDDDVKKSLDLYKKMADAKPPKGDQAEFKKKVAALIVATQEVVDKKQEGVAHYKEAVNCKACHQDFKGDNHGPGGPGRGPGGPAPAAAPGGLPPAGIR